ncbi:BTAD domain-containing putative transcriptional regulator [Streptomyces sp. NPDC059070]|uniref:AfsR/SARP family transcriptional regulator n=1 Tax=Streptomyces sp. NPDC059070 TaxID=3346713 RepID=UPI0036BC7E5B
MSLSYAQSSRPLRYEVLGRLRVTCGDADLTPAPPKIAKLLALLTVRAGETVPGDKLVAELWEQHPPRCAAASLRVYVSQLRKLLGTPGRASPIVTASPGYILDVSQNQLDVRLFERLYESGRARYAAADYPAAAECLRNALAIWRGPVLDGMSGSSEISSFAAVEEEKRLNCIELNIESALALGRHHAVIEELKGLVVQHPLREPFYRQLMAALYRVGRQGDALGVYRSARRVIRDELGVEPGTPLQLTQEAILRADPARLEAVGVTAAAR